MHSTSIISYFALSLALASAAVIPTGEVISGNGHIHDNLNECTHNREEGCHIASVVKDNAGISQKTEARSPQGSVTGEAIGGPFDAVSGVLGGVFRERRSPQGGVTGEAIGGPFNVVPEVLGGVF